MGNPRFVGNPGFVGNSIFHNRTWHPKYDERNVIFEHSRFKWKFYNAVHAPNASFMSGQLAIRWICGQHAYLRKPMASFVEIAKIFTKVLEYACYAISGSVYGETAPLHIVWGAILGALCKLDSWVTHTFMGNTHYFGSGEKTNHFS